MLTWTQRRSLTNGRGVRSACGVCVALLVSTGMHCSHSLTIYDKIVADSRWCAAQEKCSVAGGVKGCRCPVAVRAGDKARVDANAGNATCAQTERLYCPLLQNPRCEENVCVADKVRE
jgi:hypothetical protein